MIFESHVLDSESGTLTFMFHVRVLNLVMNSVIICQHGFIVKRTGNETLLYFFPHINTPACSSAVHVSPASCFLSYQVHDRPAPPTKPLPPDPALKPPLQVTSADLIWRSVSLVLTVVLVQL